MKQHLLIVEDEEFVQALIAAYLKKDGFRISVAATGKEMFAILDKQVIDLILLDLNLPDEDGLALARRIRARSSLPIIVLTARKGRDDRLSALGMGVDDYLTKPVDPEELALRVHNVLGRSATTKGQGRGTGRRDVIRFAGWAVDAAGRTVTAPDGAAVELTQAEFQLLSALARAPNRVLTRAQLLDAMAPFGESANDRMVDVMVSRLRKKMERNPRKPELIVTVTGFGYKFAAQTS
jgi:DNA-binding response OmpR family regulator